jgi:HSP20 family protein
MDMWRREFDQVFRGLGRNQSFLPGIGAGGYPRMNLSEDDSNYYIEALVPGINPEDIDLNLMRGTLSLSGERKENQNNGNTWHRHERGTGKFMRTIELSDAVDNSKVSAECRNGVLFVTLPKLQSERPKKISVQAN